MAVRWKDTDCLVASSYPAPPSINLSSAARYMDTMGLVNKAMVAKSQR